LFNWSCLHETHDNQEILCMMMMMMMMTMTQQLAHTSLHLKVCTQHCALNSFYSADIIDKKLQMSTPCKANLASEKLSPCLCWNINK
jgi:hypothetical protein